MEHRAKGMGQVVERMGILSMGLLLRRKLRTWNKKQGTEAVGST